MSNSFPTAVGTRRLSAVRRSQVRLLDSRWKDQLDRAADVYGGLDDDDVLHGFRARTVASPPGRGLTGWCRTDSAVAFGQWVSGLARLAVSTGRDDLAEKASRLVRGWAQTLGPDDDSPLDHYGFDKTLCGLVDAAHLLGDEHARSLVVRLSRWAERTLDRQNVPASPDPSLHSGIVPEWYTLSENLYRGYEVTGDERLARFAEVWQYDAYWSRFESTSEPDDAWGVHAYSHLNTFSGAAAAHLHTGDERYRRVIEHAHDFFVTTQLYATGGFGPGERLQPAGGLGWNLRHRMDHFEAPCGSWAAFKLARYLLAATGEAGYGDWAELLLHNGIGASLPTTPDGHHFYYADYRESGAVKAWNRDTFACCSGSYVQAVAEYPDHVFHHHDTGLAISQLTPASLTTRVDDVAVRLDVVEADLVHEGRVRVRVVADRPVVMDLLVRVPGWCSGVPDVQVEGRPVAAQVTPDGWLLVPGRWDDTTVSVRFAVEWRSRPVDAAHPDLVALTRGPAVFVLDAWRHEPTPGHPEPVGPPDADGSYAVARAGSHQPEARLRPFQDVPAGWSYRMHHDPQRRGLYGPGAYAPAAD